MRTIAQGVIERLRWRGRRPAQMVSIYSTERDTHRPGSRSAQIHDRIVSLAAQDLRDTVIAEEAVSLVRDFPSIASPGVLASWTEQMRTLQGKLLEDEPALVAPVEEE